MAKEVKRCFLLNSLAEVDEIKQTVIFQSYLGIKGKEKMKVYMTSDEEGQKHFVEYTNLKGGDDITHLKTEISDAMYIDLTDRIHEKSMKKTRKTTVLNGHVIVVDVYGEELQGIVIAEVLFKDEETAAAFEIPSWFGKEITDNMEYTESNLWLKIQK